MGGKITALKGYLIQNIYDLLLFIVSLTFYCVFRNFAICIQGIPAFRDFKLRGSRYSSEFAKFLRSLEQFIQTLKGQNNFW